MISAASPFRTFVHVTLPLSKTGILGASVIIALPMFGDYYTPNIVSGSPQTSMLGNQIDIYFHGGPQPAIGAALTMVLSLFLGVLMVYYMYTVAKASREVRTHDGEPSASLAPARQSARALRRARDWIANPWARPRFLRAGHLALHRLVDRAGDHRDPVLVQ